MTTKPKIIETVCKKCGEQYDRNYKACPNCGFNPFKAMLKTMGITIVLILIVASFVLTLINLTKLSDINNKLDQLNEVITTGGSQEQGADLTKYTFYKDYVLYENTVLDNLGDDYFIYFHQEDCEYCRVANNYVLAYYNVPAGKDSEEYIFDKKPVYFVTPDTANDLFNQFNIESTPTMVRMNKSKEIKRAVGTDEVNDMFAEVVQEYYPE